MASKTRESVIFPVADETEVLVKLCSMPHTLFNPVNKTYRVVDRFSRISESVKNQERLIKSINSDKVIAKLVTTYNKGPRLLLFVYATALWKYTV